MLWAVRSRGHFVDRSALNTELSTRKAFDYPPARQGMTNTGFRVPMFESLLSLHNFTLGDGSPPNWDSSRSLPLPPDVNIVKFWSMTDSFGQKSSSSTDKTPHALPSISSEEKSRTQDTQSSTESSILKDLHPLVQRRPRFIVPLSAVRQDASQNRALYKPMP